MLSVYYRYLVERKGFWYALIMQNETIKVVYEEERFLVVEKPAGLPTVPLARNPEGPSLLTWLRHDFPEVADSGGMHAHEGLILHRLDTETCGLVLAARDRESYRLIQEAQGNKLFEKTYIAATAPGQRLDGFPPLPGTWEASGEPFTVESRFRPYGRKGAQVRPVIESSSHYAQVKGGAVWYATTVTPLGVNDCGDLLYQCTIVRGFRHQVRCHLAWTGYPIRGDAAYGGVEDEVLHLAAVSIRFPHPETKRMCKVDWEGSPAWTFRIS